jgi:hypothetical protein
MSEDNFVHLSDAIFIGRQFVVTDINGPGLFGKGTDAFHVVSVSAETGSAEDVFGLIDELALVKRRNSMVILAVDSVGAAATGKKEAEIGSTFLIEKISGSVADIKLRIAPGEGGFLFLIIFGANELGVPEVILLIAFLVSIIIGKGGLNLFSSRPLLSLSEGNPFIFFLFEVLFGDVFVDVKAEFGSFRFEGSEVDLNAFVELLGQLPDGLVGLGVEVVVALGCLVVVDLEWVD